MKVVTRIFALTLAVVLVTGCLKQQVATTVESDGSGTNVIELGISKQMLRFLEMQGEENPFDEADDVEEGLDELPEEWNARAEEFESDDFQGRRLTLDFDSLEQLEEQLNSVFDYLQMDDGDAEQMPGLDQDLDRRPFLRDVNITQDDDGLVTITAEAGNEMPDELREQMQMMRAMVGETSLGWSIELPELLEFSPKEIAERDGNKVSFTFEVGKVYELKITGRLAPAGEIPGSGRSTDPDEIPGSGRSSGDDDDDADSDADGDDADAEEFGREKMLEILQGDWSFDRTSVEDAFRIDGEQVDEDVVQQILSLTVTFDENTMIMTDGDMDHSRSFEAGDAVENSLTLTLEDGSSITVRVVSRNEIWINDQHMPQGLKLTRKN